MKRIVRLPIVQVIVMLFGGLVGWGVTPAAQAAVTCTLYESGHYWHRNCGVDSSRGAGTIDGIIGWIYPLGGDGDNGVVNLYVDDRPSAGCLVLRVRYRGGTRADETVIRRVCNGDAKNVALTLNRQYLPFADGTFFVDWCESNTSKSKLLRCINMWSQRVGDAGPSR